jgi:DNA (cytosine-5)-methyltransferase 1
MKVLDLFSGIGGFSLGLERAGFTTSAFCEVDPACRKVLRKHWPDVPIFEDIRTLSATDIGETIEVICGGFPCQDISDAGTRRGIDGNRSGLWWEFHRLIKETQPKWVLAENASALRYRGLDQVLRSLSEIGYDAEWHCIPASAVGAPHIRDRTWIVAYPHNRGSGWGVEQQTICEIPWNVHPNWGSEPSVDRVADGVPNRMDRLKQLGNAVVPQIPEIIGRAIASHKHLT